MRVVNRMIDVSRRLVLFESMICVFLRAIKRKNLRNVETMKNSKSFWLIPGCICDNEWAKLSLKTNT